MSHDTMIKQLLLKRGKIKKRFFIGTVAVILLLVLAFIAYQATETDVNVLIGEEKHLIKTHAKTVEQLFEREQFNLTEQDIVLPALDTEIVQGMTIQWEPAKSVEININGDVLQHLTTKSIVKDILIEVGISVSSSDKVSPALDSEIRENLKIDVLKSFKVTLVDGHYERQVWSTPTTIRNFLSEQGIKLGELDKLNYPENEIIKEDTKLKVIRVSADTEVVEESIPFTTKTHTAPNLLSGETQVVREGIEGKIERTYETVFENGKAVAKSVISEEVIQEPRTEVVAIGSMVAPVAPPSTIVAVEPNENRPTQNSLINSSDNADVVSSFGTAEPAPQSSKVEMYVEATAYTPYCEGCTGTTKMGINVRLNTDIKVIAVDPSVIPLGSKVWVEGYGYAVAGDIGSDIKGDRIDVLVHSNIEAFKWGRKKVRVKVL